MSCNSIIHNYLECDKKTKMNPYRSFPLLPDRYRTTIRSRLTTILLNYRVIQINIWLILKLN